MWPTKRRANAREQSLEAGIPPPEINYNQVPVSDHAAYVREFKERACLRELPFLMRAAGLTPSSSLLDYGCGLGRLAYAASKYLSPEGAYFGYEPNALALAFLRDAYAGRRNFAFDGRPLRREEDYVAINLDEARVGGDEATAIDLPAFVTRPVDVEWSCSVFTHMWPDAIAAVLRGVGRVMAPGGFCVNTWLCVDDFASYALRCGVADRELPHRFNSALTSSESNPLDCVAYEIETVRAIYERAGHRILDILWGSWTGRDNGVIYQDIVISGPR